MATSPRASFPQQYFSPRIWKKPVLVEGPAGVGKTELAKALSKTLERELIRLQCYEGLDEAKALYEWEYGKQLLYTHVLREKINQGDRPDRDAGAGGTGAATAQECFFLGGLLGRKTDPARNPLQSARSSAD